ncbi:uncharacterized protein ACWYII_046221 isoform 2-T5 [Salvelinus alpinus]
MVLATSSPAPLQGRTEYDDDINTIKNVLKNCHEGCSTSGMDLKCQCLQIPITSVETCTPDYFKQGLASLSSVHPVARLLSRRLNFWSNPGFQQLAPHCEPVVSPRVFLEQLRQVFQGLNIFKR